MALRFTYIDPRYMTFMEWACQMCMANDGIAEYVQPEGEDDWQGWGRAWAGTKSLQNRDIPDPYLFDVNDWKGWAARLMETLT